MHIETSLLTQSNALLSVASATGVFVILGRAWQQEASREGHAALLVRAAVAVPAVLVSFEIFPHYPVGVSEVHFIFGTTLFLLLGMAPAGVGLALGLLGQGIFFAPHDLPQYGMNVTTLLMSLLTLAYVARKTVSPGTRYVDLSYSQALAFSCSFQAGVVAWVAFWTLHGGGLAGETLLALASFASAYALVILIEPFVDLGALWIAKSWERHARSGLVSPLLYARTRVAGEP